MAKKNNIRITRGESKAFNVFVPDSEGESRELATGEKLVFGVVRNTNDEEYLITKTLTSANYDSESGKYLLKIDPADTEEMDVAKYNYDIWLVSGGEKIPVIGWSTFELTPNAVSAGRGL